MIDLENYVKNSDVGAFILTGKDDIQVQFKKLQLTEGWAMIDNKPYFTKVNPNANNDFISVIICEIKGNNLIVPKTYLGAILGKGGAHIKALNEKLGKSLKAKELQ